MTTPTATGTYPQHVERIEALYARRVELEETLGRDAVLTIVHLAQEADRALNYGRNAEAARALDTLEEAVTALEAAAFHGARPVDELEAALEDVDTSADAHEIHAEAVVGMVRTPRGDDDRYRYARIADTSRLEAERINRETDPAARYSAPRTFDVAADWRALAGRTDALLVTDAGDERILEADYNADGILVVTTSSGDHHYGDTVTVRMPMTERIER